MAKFPSSSIFKFADDTTVVGRIAKDDMEYRKEIENLVNWCNENNLSLNVNKMKEIIIDFRKCRGEYAPYTSMGTKWKGSRASSF